jgi:hypothetical protein
MNFRNRMKDRRTTMFFGMVFLVVALGWPRFLHPTTPFGDELSDGVRGLMFGLSFGLNLWTVRLAARQRGCGGN